MEDMQSPTDQLLDEANDCDLIGNLATDQRKRATFRRMARELRGVAARLRADIAARDGLRRRTAASSAVSTKPNSAGLPSASGLE
jgi:hypothetical protein